MAVPSQGFFWWPGIQTFLHGSFTFTHGIGPSLCQLYIAPQLVWPDMFGQLTVNYLPGVGTAFFNDCILDFISIERGPDGRQVWGLHILDRRWKWKDCGRISGVYNVRRSNGDGESSIWTQTAMPLPDLMALCLDAMGEEAYGYDISQVEATNPKTYPEIEWDYENPAQALLKLCDDYGYRVILTLQGQVLIAVANEGNYLPDAQYMSGATTINPPNTPSAIVAVAGRTVVQYDFELEAVGLELDGTLVPIDELSYTPDNGWEASGGDLREMLNIAEGDARNYALKSVFKYYRITPPFFFWQLDELNPGNDDIDDRRFCLPLLDVQLDKSPETPDAPASPLPAWVYGIWDGNSSVVGNQANEIDCTIREPKESLGWIPTERFSIDRDRGLVIFNEPIWSRDTSDQNNTSEMFPAQLRLRTSCNVRDQETMGWLRHEKQYDLPNPGGQTLPMYVKFDDVALKITMRFDADGIPDASEDNLEDVEQTSDYYLQAALKKLTLDDPQSFEYPGFAFIELDGAIQQVTWTVDDSGRATTHYNRNKEDLVNTPSYEEAKQAALLQMALANAEKAGRVKKQDASQTLTVSGN